MKFYFSQNTVRQPDSGYAFQFPPVTRAVGFTKVVPDADSGTGRNDLNLSDPSNNFKFHCL